ncbi:MAG: hypothetical protein P8L79_13530 [Rhodospirillaceae bacterium]|jgi:hypothetical protein|nr:hypothetical protein [Rhodospirillaceae bacterium]
MPNGTNPDFVLVQAEETATPAALAALPMLISLAAEKGAACLADVSYADVDALEPGSIPYTSQILKFENEAATESFWDAVKADPTTKPILIDPKVRVLAAQGLPKSGIPGDPLPTIASDFEMPTVDGLPGYMFIDGEAYDAEKLMVYRGIIFELMLERASYYLVICEADGVRVLSGSWDEKIFAISKWPTKGHGLDFWYCDRYQNEGIPTRAGAGHFHVNMFEGK